MKLNLNRIGVVTVPSISICHFKKAAPNFLSLYCNPAQLVLINSKAAKDCKYDKKFSNFRSDTDFTMQIAHKGYIPVMLNRYFSFMHTVPLSKLEFDETGKRRFGVLDNVTETRGSVGGDRRFENKIVEYDAFKKKWPKTITVGNYKHQRFADSVVHLTKFNKMELQEYEKHFDYSLIKDYLDKYYKGLNVEKNRNKKRKLEIF